MWVRGNDAWWNLVHDIAKGLSNTLPALQCLCCHTASGQKHLSFAGQICSWPGHTCQAADGTTTVHISMDPEGQVFRPLQQESGWGRKQVHSLS